MISVLLPYRSAAATLEDAMTSTLADLDAADELVAIDDGSSDASLLVARRVAERDGRVVLAASGGTPERAAGVARALARGLEAARGDRIGRMDADDRTLPGRFAAQRELLDGDAGLGAVGVQVEAFPGPTPGMQRYLAWQASLVSRAEHANAIFVESPLCHPATLIRREALVAVGGFRETTWAEDYDLWLRLDAAGWGLAKVPRVLFHWRMRAGSVWRTDPRCSPAQFLAARAFYLAQRLRERGVPFAVWGAGQTGRRLARALEPHGCRPVAFVDIDAKKVGREARGARVVAAEEGVGRAVRRELVLVVAVGAAGARDEVRARLRAAGLAEGDRFICAA